MLMHASDDDCEVVSLVMRCHGERAIKQCMFAHVCSNGLRQSKGNVQIGSAVVIGLAKTEISQSDVSCRHNLRVVE
eukprot:g36189.t1